MLRIEDTDRARFDADATAQILHSMEWLGITADESVAVGGEYGPYVQSERLALYRQHADMLVQGGAAYWAYDSHAELAELRERGRGYDGRGRARSAEENEARRAQGIAGVVRFITPRQGSSGWDDLILGSVSRANKDLACDPVLLKADGYPTYHLASVVDDHLMHITHVLRAQEWLSSTPLHVLLYAAYGWGAPHYAHLPIIIGRDGKKLSKRFGATSVHALQQDGIMAEALCNYIALLGWSYDGSREHFTLAELERFFSIAQVQKSAAAFDWDKLRWHNAYYLRQMSTARFLQQLRAVLPSPLVDALPADATRQEILCDALKERISSMLEAEEWLGYLRPIVQPDGVLLCGKKLSAVHVRGILQQMLTMDMEAMSSVAAVRERLRTHCDRHALPFGHSMGVLRVALSGRKSSLPVDVLVATLSAADIQQRWRSAVRVVAA